MLKFPFKSTDDAPDLNKLLAFWKPALGLSDWLIHATYDRFLGNDNVAHVNVMLNNREARIRVLDPAMVTFDWPPHDVELHFVHELVHCVVEPMARYVDKDVPDVFREQTIEQLAKALVRLHRVYPIENDWIATRAPAAPPAAPPAVP